VSYAEEREYLPGIKFVKVYQYLRDVGPLTVEEAADIVGCGIRNAYLILNHLEGEIQLYKEGKRWYLLGNDEAPSK